MEESENIVRNEVNGTHSLFENETHFVNEKDSQLMTKYLINTRGCAIVLWPLFDSETKRLFINHANETFNCKNDIEMKIKRINGTFIQLITNENWTSLECFANVQSVRPKTADGDSIQYIMTEF
jgi:hypothetical protein